MRRSLSPLIALGSALVVLACLLVPSPALAATYPPWEEGLQGHPFHLLAPISSAVEVVGSADQRLELARLALVDLGPTAPMWEGLSADKPDPRMAYPLANGHALISGGKDAPFVKEVDAAGNVVWEYKNGSDGLIRKPFSAEPATFGGRRCVLISDRVACRVFAVTWDAVKEIVWQYGVTDVPGSGVNELADPFCATQLEPTTGQTDGDILIADSNDNHRVIEVRSDDYDDAAADGGYSASSLVWQYGVTGHYGSEAGYLNQARSPQRLPNGDTLITDAAGRRVIEVRTSDYDPSKPANGYTDDSVVRSYVDGVDGALGDPNTARYVTSGPLTGDVVVTDCGQDAQCVRIIDWTTKQTSETIDLRTFARPDYVGTTDISSPRDARFDQEGALWIADAGFGRVMRVGNEGTGTVTSQALTCGKANMVKAFVRLKLDAPTQASGTSFALWYSIDDDAFVRARVSSDGRNVYFPAGSSGTRIAYRVTLTSDHPWQTPVVEGLTIHFTKAATGGGGGGGGGSGGTGNSGSSGVYAYPSTAVGGTGSFGTGSGSGGYGAGPGSGTTGTGIGNSGAGSGVSTPANAVDVPVESTGSGPAQAVQGYQMQGAEGVSGVPLKAARGPQAPEPERPGPAVPILALVAAGLVVAAASFIPWPFVAARLRRFTGFDHTRPARVLPFRLLGR